VAAMGGALRAADLLKSVMGGEDDALVGVFEREGQRGEGLKIGQAAEGVGGFDAGGGGGIGAERALDGGAFGTGLERAEGAKGFGADGGIRVAEGLDKGGDGDGIPEDAQRAGGSGAVKGDRFAGGVERAGESRGVGGVAAAREADDRPSAALAFGRVEFSAGFVGA